MIIRSQNELCAVVFGELAEIYIDERPSYDYYKKQKAESVICFDRGFNDTLWLGFYDSEETAKKIIEDIINSYLSGCKIYQMPKKQEE